MDTHFQVAIEMGFRRADIALAQQNHYFKRAGDLVAYLCDQFSEMTTESEKEEEHVAQSMEQKNDSHETAVNELSLEIKEKLALSSSVHCAESIWNRKRCLQETLALYSSTHCLKCKWSRKRTINLPCCHIALCKPCALKTFICPFKDCDEKIENTLDIIF